MKSIEFKVGLFVLVCVGIVVAMSLQISKDPNAIGGGQYYDVLLPNANGVFKNSTIRMAGIPVGTIKTITLENGNARLLLSLRPDLKLTKSASVEVKPSGILGDKFVEIKTGNPGDEPLPPGGRILIVKDTASFDAVLDKVGQIADDFSVVASNLKKATTGEGDPNTPLGRIVMNVEDLTADLRDFTSENKNRLTNTVTSLERITKNLDQFIGDETDDGFKRNWQKMAKSLGKVDKILTNVDEITSKVNDGKGTLGKLINDETTVEELNHAISGVNRMLDTANKFQISVDYHSEFMPASGATGESFVKSYVGLNIQPGPDRYYLLQIVDDPKAEFQRTDTLTSVGGGPNTTTRTQVAYHNQIKFSAQFAKSFYDLTLRAGLFENSAGVGFDYHFFNKKLRITSEFFKFGRAEGVDIRAYARYKFYSVFYAVAGGDDIANTRGNDLTGTRASAFFGLGLDFTSDDMKLLMSKLPF
ncbi:MAG: MCE family protein [Oligoflexia bacterium]|nr:MCE family protein [Oligoflexia bacterium]